MEKCKHCTLADSNRECFAQEGNWSFQCDFINPEHPKFHPKHVEKHLEWNGLKEPEQRSTFSTLMKTTKGFVNSVKEHVSNGMPQATPDQQRERLAICQACPSLIKETNPRCGECKCFVQVKTRWALEKCPLDLWGQIINSGVSESVVAEPCVPCSKQSQIATGE
jgi:hypothetical protein